MSYDWPKAKQLHQSTFDKVRIQLTMLERKYGENLSIVSDIKAVLNRC